MIFAGIDFHIIAQNTWNLRNLLPVKITNFYIMDTWLLWTLSSATAGVRYRQIWPYFVFACKQVSLKAQSHVCKTHVLNFNGFFLISGIKMFHEILLIIIIKLLKEFQRNLSPCKSAGNIVFNCEKCFRWFLKYNYLEP